MTATMMSWMRSWTLWSQFSEGFPIYSSMLEVLSMIEQPTAAHTKQRLIYRDNISKIKSENEVPLAISIFLYVCESST